MYLRKNYIANNANMELTNVNSNGENVATSNQNNTNSFFWKIVKIELKNVY
jgi:hypothetical protein